MDAQDEVGEIRMIADGNMPISKEKALKIQIPNVKSFNGARRISYGILSNTSVLLICMVLRR